MLYMRHRCGVIYPLANYNIFMGMLFIYVALLLSTFDMSLELSFYHKGILGMIFYQVQLNDGKN